MEAMSLPYMFHLSSCASLRSITATFSILLIFRSFIIVSIVNKLCAQVSDHREDSKLLLKYHENVLEHHGIVAASIVPVLATWLSAAPDSELKCGTVYFVNGYFNQYFSIFGVISSKLPSESSGGELLYKHAAHLQSSLQKPYFSACCASVR